MYTVIAHSASAVSVSGFSDDDLKSSKDLKENVRVVAAMKDMIMAPEEPGEVRTADAPWNHRSSTVASLLYCGSMRTSQQPQMTVFLSRILRPSSSSGHAVDGRRVHQDHVIDHHRVRLHRPDRQGRYHAPQDRKGRRQAAVGGDEPAARQVPGSHCHRPHHRWPGCPSRLRHRRRHRDVVRQHPRKRYVQHNPHHLQTLRCPFIPPPLLFSWSIHPSQHAMTSLPSRGLHQVQGARAR